MFGHFYNQRVKKAVAVFGSLFNDIYVVRRGSGTASFEQEKVPLSYGPQRKFLERIEQMQNGEEAERQIAIKLPRMSFEMTAITYDPERQLPKTNTYCRSIPGDANRAGQYYIATPYIISFQLSVYGKTQDDCLQVCEQIIPYFAPQYTVTIFPYDDVDDITEDVPISMSGISFSDDYEGDMPSRRTIVYTLDFEMKVNFHGPSPRDGLGTPIIREVNTDFVNFDQRDSDGFISRVQVTTDPADVSPDSDFTFVTRILDSDG